jgi:hypothetical protein
LGPLVLASMWGSNIDQTLTPTRSSARTRNGRISNVNLRKKGKKGNLSHYLLSCKFLHWNKLLMLIIKLKSKIPRVMRNRILFTAFALTICFSSSFGQKYNSEFEYMQSEFGKDKKTMVRDFMRLSKEEGEKFWPTYDAYEKRRLEMGEERFQLLQEYLQNYETLDDAGAADWMEKLFDSQIRESTLLIEYYNKMKVMLRARRGMQFYQMEVFFAIEVRTAILEEVPFIGED